MRSKAGPDNWRLKEGRDSCIEPVRDWMQDSVPDCGIIPFWLGCQGAPDRALFGGFNMPANELRKLSTDSRRSGPFPLTPLLTDSFDGLKAPLVSRGLESGET